MTNRIARRLRRHVSNLTTAERGNRLGGFSLLGYRVEAIRKLEQRRDTVEGANALTEWWAHFHRLTSAPGSQAQHAARRARERAAARRASR